MNRPFHQKPRVLFVFHIASGDSPPPEENNIQLEHSSV